MSAKPILGTFPFGSPLDPLVQQDRAPKPIFVLGVYASAVHARWIGPDGRELVKALAVASEPWIFWDGTDAAQIIAAIDIPSAAGRLEPPSDAGHNGGSGQSLDERFLGPLGVARDQAWLCDLVPHTCLNDNQLAAIEREYEPRREEWRLKAVSLPEVPASFADEARRAEILSEIAESGAKVVVLLGDEPIRHFLRHVADGDRRRTLRDFCPSDSEYGQLVPMTIAGRPYRIVPLVHPRQAAGLGRYSQEWFDRHKRWCAEVAPTLLGRV